MINRKCHNRLRFQIWLLGIIWNLAFGFWNIASVYAQDKIVAIVNNEAISQKDLSDFMTFMKMQLSQEYSGEQLEDKVRSIKSDLLGKLIEDHLILQEAKINGIKADEVKVRERVDEIKKRYPSINEFQNALAQEGLVQADIEAKIKEQLLMYNIIEVKVKSKIVINPGEVTDFYNKNLGTFEATEQRDFESVSFLDMNKAKEAYSLFENGQSLEDLAQKNSLTVNKLSAQKGEELREDIENIVFKLKPGEVSEPVRIQDSFYIFRLVNIAPAKQLTLPEVRDKIYSFLYNKKMQESLFNWIQELKRKSFINIIKD